jgi:LuxR family transcriptional regulator, maltose regulon positive regulatory protein
MIAHLARARILVLEGRVAEAGHSGARAAELAGRGAGLVEVAAASILLGQLLAETGDRDAARAAVGRARWALDRSPDPGGVGEALAQTERRLGRRRRRATSELPGDELSERELAVLRLLPTRLSQREIDASLYVSVNTVKTHTKSIFRKLGVSTRAEAVARSRELGLL